MDLTGEVGKMEKRHVGKLSITRPMSLFLWVAFFFAILMGVSGCSDDEGSSSKTLVTGVVWSDVDGTGAIASVSMDDRDIENARLTVNNVTLDYGLPIEFITDTGLSVSVAVPVYYADLGSIGSGDAVDFIAKSPVGNILFQHTAVAIPGRATIVSPVEGAIINVNEDVPIQWREASGAQGYVAGYSESNAFDEEPAPDDDVGFFAEYADSSARELTLPSTYTVLGDALFWTTAVSGDVNVLASEEDVNESYFVVGSSDWVQATITADAALASSVSDTQPEEDRGSQGLRIVKEYSKKIKGYRFKVRECDPNQIQSPGTISLGFKLRRFKASIAFVEAYDINGNKYFSWDKARIYKSKSKKYYPSFSASPGTTVVFGTHDASYRGGTYSY
jgi:hypothetical protein